MSNPIGQLLVREGLISAAQLAQTWAYQSQNNIEFKDSLVSLGYLTSEQVSKILHPIPVAPIRSIDTGLNVIFLTDLLLKTAYIESGTFNLHSITKALCLPYSIVDELIQLLKADHQIAIRSATNYGRETQTFELTQRGRERAEAALDISLYVGATPVPLQSYTRILVQQYIQQIEVDNTWINNALQHMTLGEKLLSQLGPAFSSGHSIFLYGPPGTGKSTIAEALGRAMPDHIYIPQAVEVNGQVIRVYDPAIHYSIEEKNKEVSQLDIAANLKHDPRWKKCRRPVVMVGGELTLDMLDLRFDIHAKFYEAPIHMKAANGIFILDDFGRQKMSPREMLNRWIVPLERGTDFLSLHTGMKFEIPFDQISIFCTNLNPAELMDEAFLRRIRHKIKIPYSTEEEFRHILRRVCQMEGIDYDEHAASYLIDSYYQRKGRQFVGSHPRDLVRQIIDHARFCKEQPIFSRTTIDAAADNYFVEY